TRDFRRGTRAATGRAMRTPLAVSSLAFVTLALAACHAVLGGEDTGVDEQANIVVPRLPPLTLRTDVVTQHNDNARTGLNNRESVLSTTSVAPGKFGQICTTAVEGQVYAQPLYVTGAIGGRDVLYVASEANYVYALDAQSDCAKIWGKQIGTPAEL